MVTIQNGRFRDPQGRQVLLHGINLVNKDPRTGYIGPEDQNTFASFQRWGFNCIRLGVIWDGLEPQPGIYNEFYLQNIERQIGWSHENNIMVFLDMHQDLYSVLYSDGAPAWATLHEGQPHVGNHEVWSDAYFSSPAVQASLDNFWMNTPAPDGIGLQDHLAACWKLLAQRFGKHPAVIGYDLLNEPVPGSASPLALELQFSRGAELLAQPGSGFDGFKGVENGNPVEALLDLWSTHEGRFQILQILSNPQLYQEVVEAPRIVYNQFEQEQLMPFYQRVAAAIRSVDSRGVLFLETSMGSNMGVTSAIQPVKVGGRRDPVQAYAPHGYDLVVDTPNIALASPERVDLIFSRHAETARNQNWPMLVGEWGAFGSHVGTLPAARDVVRIFERLLCSDTYWAYEPGIENADCFQALSRPYPDRIAGELDNYRHDPLSRTFECTWTENPTLTDPSVVYLPGWFGFDPDRVRIEPPEQQLVHVTNGSEGTWLHIPPTGQVVKRMLKYQENFLIS